MTEDDAPELIAYVLNTALSTKLVPAPAARDWMEATDARFANRCLPLLIANQSGWLILSEHSLRATWNGEPGLGGVSVETLEGPIPHPAASHFGHGILTFSLPYLFRTSPGYNLLVRGPANLPKDGASALEGVVETDWCPATFTVNWQLTRKQHAVTFERGEPIAMLVPQRRGELEAFRPALRALESDRETLGEYQKWSRARAQFLADLRTPNSEAVRRKWQKDYFQGISPDGASIAQHQTKLQLRSFAAASEAEPKASGEPRAVRASAPNAGAPASAAERERLLADVVAIEDFLDADVCERLCALHRRHVALSTHSDNALDAGRLLAQDRDGFELVHGAIGRIRALAEAHFKAHTQGTGARLCAITEGGFRRTLHADGVAVECPRHGSDAEQLVRSGCDCAELELQPSRTPERKYAALVWLNTARGGELVIGSGPSRFGRAFRTEFTPTRGLLVLTPTSEHYFQHTNSVVSGTLHSLECWLVEP